MMGASRELAELASAYNSGGLPSFKNRIINGDMGIWQRGTSFTGLASNSVSATYTADRFACNKGNGSTGVVTFSQSSDVPTGSGLPYSLLITVTTTAASMNASEYNAVNQVIEGFNIADLSYGTANASTSVLSFWAKASVTGTYCGTLIQRGAATQKTYPFTYVVSVANTWVQYFITVTGDTAGTIPYSNAAGFEVDWYYGIGSNYASGVANTWNTNASATQYVSSTGVNMLATNGATLRITGVQLEKGSTATSFDYRPYGTELALCQRYCVKYGGTGAFETIGYGFATSTTVANISVYTPVTMRAQPSLTLSSTSPYAVQVSDGITGFAGSAFAVNTTTSGVQQIGFGITSSGLTANRAYRVETTDVSRYVLLTAEL